MKSLLTALVMFLMLTSQTASASISKCCDQGVNKGMKVTSESVKCADNEVDFGAVPDTDRMMCSVIFKRCCETAAERELCTEGISRAMSGLNCTERVGAGGKAQKRCCNCCKGGVQQALSGGPCNVKQETQFCSDAFAACCKNPGLGPKVTSNAPSTTKITIGTMKPTTAAVTSLGTAKMTTASAKKRPMCLELQCTHGCETMSESGEGRCVCNKGYRLAADKQTCNDIDECVEKTFLCPTDHECKNTAGSFMCTRVVINKKCSVAGYLTGPDGKCVDEDECQRQTEDVCNTGEVCLNTDGSFICLQSCPYGYKKAGKICEDVDECAGGGRKCPTNFQCINTQGSYHCMRTSCESGYALLNDQCHDINECEEDANVCGEGGRCLNQQGSFYCVCGSGYTRNAFTGKCEDLDECRRDQDSCAHSCTNTKGSYTCQCPKGYTSIGRNCIDINECSENLATCPEGFSCFNRLGGYACIRSTCPSDFYIQRSKFECKLYCQGRDACNGILVQSIKWVAYSFRKTLPRGNFAFTYFLRVNSYLSTTISFYFAQGNEERGFFIQRLDKESVRITNVKQLTGPREYNLRLHADIIYNGKATSRFVYMFYLYLSEYDL